MAAPKGNSYWMKRSSHGRKPIIEDPKELMRLATEYFEHVENTPMLEYKAMVVQGLAETIAIPKPRPYTQVGMCLYAGIDQETYAAYRKKDDFAAVTRLIDDTIMDQKFSGAAAGLFNANIIARDLGLKDANTTELSGPDGGPIVTDIQVEFIVPDGKD